MQIILRTLLLSLFFMLPAITAHASVCDATREGVIIYNTDHKLVQFCNGTNWIGLVAKIGGAGDTLSDLNCQAGEIVKWNGSNWTCAADDAGMSGLPALGPANIWVGNASNAATAVAMSGDATLSNAGALAIANNAVTSAKIADGTIANADIANATIVATAKLSATGTKDSTTFLRGDNTWAAPPSGADNLGNHTAMTTLDMASQRIDNMGRISGGSWNATYDAWLQGSEFSAASGDARNLALLGNKSTDTLYLNYGGEYTGGTVIGGVITGNGSGLTNLNAVNLASGTVAAARMPALTGDVTMTAGTTATTIANNAVTSAKIADGTITAADTAIVGTLTEGKWCSVSSGKIVCVQDAPSGGSGGANFQTFTTTGTSTWNKPATGTIAFVECWGAGGSGARYSTAGAGKGGGGGGGYSSSWLPLTALPASVTVTVGVGGAARSSNGDGSAGGNSAFGSFVTGYGGGGGEGGSTAKGGGGGGQMSAGSIGTPGRPFMLVGYNPNTEDTSFAGSGGWSKTVMASGYPYPAGDGTNHGGGGGGGTLAATVAGGDSVYGGGGGGGRVSSTNGAAGMSLFAGAGGAGGAPASDGQQPGGGGGGSSTTSGKGGDGQCNVTVF